MDLCTRLTNKQIYSATKCNIKIADRQINKQQQFCKDERKQNTNTKQYGINCVVHPETFESNNKAIIFKDL